MEPKKWYSFAENGKYTGSEPAFFDVQKKKWGALFENNYAQILNEFTKIIESRDKNIVPYFNQTLANKAENWTVFPLYQWGKKQNENCEKCPETTRIIESISSMTTCSFSILKPQTTIKPHFGDSNVMYRCHFTLRCKGELPEIGMRVKDQQISWKEGQLFAFCDAHEHEVWNKTNDERWVLIIDILREEFEADKKKICAEVNATLWWQLKFQNFYFLKHLPKWSRKLLMKFTSLFF
ncbi:MAG: aspartyl/asparaginyl beta-hydroxylase domain-containing protein [Bacteroidia bacterium]